MPSLSRALGAASLFAALAVLPRAHAADAVFADAKVQAPEIRQPGRGSLAGQYANVAFAPGDMSRGAFALPIPIELPTERGKPLLSPLPAYSPEGGLGEWGIGWTATGLSIERSRAVGDIDYGAEDERTGPWGRMVRGDDGAFYAVGLASRVRLVEQGDELVATLPDGTEVRFGGEAVTETARGTFAWHAFAATDLDGHTTTIAWDVRPGKRALPVTIAYGGVGSDGAYTVTLEHAPLTRGFVDYRSGEAITLDRRVTRVTTRVRHAESGAWTERYHHDLTYEEDELGPGFRLATVQQVLASGDAMPPVTYAYASARAMLAAATPRRVPKLDALVATYGADVLQPHKVSQLDADEDGRPDLEHPFDNRLLRQTDAGFAVETLPAMPAGADPLCRRSPASWNEPRLLARLTGGDAPLSVVTTKRSGASTALRACTREGIATSGVVLAGDWELSPTVRLADVDRDQKPDLVRAAVGAVEVRRNTSDASGVSFGPSTVQALSPSVSPLAAWVLDLGGDGVADLIVRHATGFQAHAGTGGGGFVSAGGPMPVLTTSGAPLSALSGYQVAFFDANGDGLSDLLLFGGTVAGVFVNDGTAFRQAIVPALGAQSFTQGKPVAADLAGTGDTELAFVKAGQAYSLALDAPGVGLLQSADDGKGTRLSFTYGRAPAEPGVVSRHALLSRLSVRSTGYPEDVYTYGYDTPRRHTLGRFLLGYEHVARSTPLDAERLGFRHDDRVVGVLVDSRATDMRSPGLAQVGRRTYADATFRGVPFARLVAEERGVEGATGSSLERTEYLAWEDDVCAAHTRTTNEHGVLETTTTHTHPTRLAGALACTQATSVVTGTHADASFDFRHEGRFVHDDAGRLLELTTHGPDGALVGQRVAYDAQGRQIENGSPREGRSTFAYDASTGLIVSSTSEDGVVTEVGARDPVTDAIQLHRVRRGALVHEQGFAFDGLERLSKRWDTLSGGSSESPNELLAYRYASGDLPGLIAVSTRVDGTRGVWSHSAVLQTAAGDELAVARRIGEGWTFESLAKRERTARRVTSLVRPAHPGAIEDVTVTALLASATAVHVRETAMLGFVSLEDAVVSATAQKRITGAASFETTLVRRQVENDDVTSIVDLDAKLRTTGYRDPGGFRTGYAYDAYGRLRRVTLPDGATHRVTFDAHGRVARIDRDGVASITYAYEAGTGRLVTRSYLADPKSAAAGTQIRTVTYDYDAHGRIVTERSRDDQANTEETITRTWDEGGQIGLPTRIAGPGFEKRLEHRADGKRVKTTLTLAGFRSVETTLSFADDGTHDGRTVTVSDETGTVLQTSTERFVRDAWGRVASVEKDGHPFAQIAHDGLGRPAQVTFQGPDAHGEVLDFEHDPVTQSRTGTTLAGSVASSVRSRLSARGFVAEETVTLPLPAGARTTTYGYSARGFLSSASDGATALAYDYDAVGLPSRIDRTTTAGTETRTFTRTGDTLTASGIPHRFDALGRVVSRGDLTLTYGPRGHVAWARRGAKEWSYLYDETGARIAKVDGGKIVRAFLEDGAVLEADRRTQPVVVSGNVAGVLDRTNAGASTFTLLTTDARGSVRADETGTEMDLSPYGEREAAARHARAAIVDYAARGWDADLGVVRMGVRDYDPFLARFLTPDPLYLESPERCLESALECNLYVYANDNPLQFVDGDGQAAVLALPAGAMAIIAVAVVGFCWWVSLPAENKRILARGIADLVTRANDAMAASGMSAITAIATFKVTEEQRQQARTRTFEVPRLCIDTKATQEGHHTVPVALMTVMRAEGMISQKVLTDLTPTNRDGMLYVDRKTHEQIHKALSLYLLALHPQLSFRLGFQWGSEWQAYVTELIRINGGDVQKAKTQILMEFAVFYGAITLIEDAQGCDTSKGQNAIVPYLKDAARLAPP